MTNHSLPLRGWLAHFTDELSLVNNTCGITAADKRRCTSNLDFPSNCLHTCTTHAAQEHANTVTVSHSLSHTQPPPSLPSPSFSLAHIYTHMQGDTRGRVDATLSAARWGVLLLTAVWIEAAVHPLLSGCCRAAGLAFVLHSIMARHNYSLSRIGTQAASTLLLASPHRVTEAHTVTHLFHVCTQVKYVSPWCVSLSVGSGTGSHALYVLGIL